MQDLVDVWFGQAKSKRDYDAFLKEKYKSRGPISAFAASQGETFYDHDFLESAYHRKPHSSEALLTGVSYGDSFVKDALAAVGEFSPTFFICLFGAQFDEPRSFESDPITLRYAGRFEYDPKAQPFGLVEAYGHRFLHVLGGRRFPLNGEPTNRVQIDAMGLMIGKGKNPWGSLLDISEAVPSIADFQVRISTPEPEIWEVRDMMGGGFLTESGTVFNQAGVKTSGSLEFEVGEVRFLLSQSPDPPAG